MRRSRRDIASAPAGLARAPATPTGPAAGLMLALAPYLGRFVAVTPSRQGPDVGEVRGILAALVPLPIPPFVALLVEVPGEADGRALDLVPLPDLAAGGALRLDGRAVRATPTIPAAPAPVSTSAPPLSPSSTSAQPAPSVPSASAVGSNEPRAQPRRVAGPDALASPELSERSADAEGLPHDIDDADPGAGLETPDPDARARILAAIRSRGPTLKADLRRTLGLGHRRLTFALAELYAEGVVTRGEEDRWQLAARAPDPVCSHATTQGGRGVASAHPPGTRVSGS